MEILNQTFTNREIAIILWIFIAISLVLFRKPEIILKTAKILRQQKFVLILSSFIIYILGLIFLLRNIKLWDTGNIKETLFWVCFIGFGLIFNATQTEQSSYFKKVFLNAIKWMVILEFILNFYTFGLLVEFIMIPFIVFIQLLQTVSEMDKKNIQGTNLLNNILSIIGWFYLCFALYKTFDNTDNFIAFTTLKSFLLPILLTILFIPYIYFIALYSSYENFFTNLGFMTTNKKKVKKAKKLILRVANIRLDKLYRITKNFNRTVFYEDTNLKSYLLSISKKNINQPPT